MGTSGSLISFACDGCGRPFSVPASFAGRKATCKTCGNKVTVPSAPTPAAQRQAAPVSVNGNGKSLRPTASSPRPAPTTGRTHSEIDVPTADPTTPIRHASPVAVISEAQSPPGSSPAPIDTRSEREQLLDDDAPARSAPAKTPKLPMRIRRLMVDAEQVNKVFDGSGPIRVQSAVGDPPELYRVEYHVKGLQRSWLGKPKKRDLHLVEIQLTSEYPRISPKCRMLTPVFHPNIDETTVCVGDHWTAGERLVDLIVRIGEMLAYQDYNIKSPLNGEAAMWADLNPQKLPVDSQNLHPTE